jgi:hypothetical protein
MNEIMCRGHGYRYCQDAERRRRGEERRRDDRDKASVAGRKAIGEEMKPN